MSIDTTRALRRPADLDALVRAVLQGEINSETDWIEWKTIVDLEDNRWCGEIARHILGFANRDPATAISWAEGCGYLLLGVEPANVPGVRRVDPSVLDARVSKYVGDRGPNWSAHYVPIEGADVLVVLVEPPKWGDPIFTLRQTYESAGRSKHGYFAGEIFVRHKGRTEKASPSDVDRLTTRAHRASQLHGIQVLLSDAQDPIGTVDFSIEAALEWLADERLRLSRPNAPLPVPGTIPHADLDAFNATLARALSEPFYRREDRTAEAFDAELNAYLDAARAAMPGHVTRRAIESGVGVIDLQVVNQTDHNFTDIEVEVYVPGNVAAYFDAHDVEDGFPKPPRKWGTPPSSLFDGLGSMSPYVSLRDPHPVLRGSIRNGGSARITLGPNHLRPRSRLGLERFYLIVDSKSVSDSVPLEWTATATNASGVASGTLELPVSDSQARPATLLNGPNRSL